MRRPALAFLVRYTIPLAAVGLALALTLSSSVEHHHPSVIFLVAVTVSAWFGGLGPGLLATVLSVFAVNYYFIPELNRIDFGPDTWIWCATYLGAALLINWLQEKQRRLIAALRRQDRQKSEFMAVLAHELRNFLSPVATAVEVIKVRASADPRTAPACSSAERQLSNLSRLVNDLLDAARITQGKVPLSLKPVDLTAIMTQALECARPALESRGHRLETCYSEAPVLVEADPFRMEQVFVNLLTNAAKYTDPGGRICVTLGHRDRHAVVSVCDNGKGLDPEILPNVFDLFVQAQTGAHGGLGIGLSLAKAIVELHGGKIVARSAGPGQGSEFVVSLPALPPGTLAESNTAITEVSQASSA
jgi:signal transduction histidine kinase